MAPHSLYTINVMDFLNEISQVSKILEIIVLAPNLPFPCNWRVVNEVDFSYPFGIIVKL